MTNQSQRQIKITHNVYQTELTANCQQYNRIFVTYIHVY